MLSVDLAAPRQYQHLTIFPLVTPADVHRPYELLVDAIQAGKLKVTEVTLRSIP